MIKRYKDFIIENKIVKTEKGFETPIEQYKYLLDCNLEGLVTGLIDVGDNPIIRLCFIDSVDDIHEIYKFTTNKIPSLEEIDNICKSDPFYNDEYSKLCIGVSANTRQIDLYKEEISHFLELATKYDVDDPSSPIVGMRNLGKRNISLFLYQK